jgi:hypothetical protein
MNTRLLLSLSLAATLAIASNAALACHTEQPISFLGTIVPEQSPADEVVVIADATRYVNVTGGTTVRFVAGERSFTWNFETGGARIVPFDLERIAPRGFLNHRVVAYVADDPLYQG